LQDDWTHVWDDKLRLLQRLVTKDKQAVSANDLASLSSPSTVPAVSTNCKLDYIVNNRSQNGLSARFKVYNVGQIPVNSWSLVWQYPENVQIVNSWGANLTLQGNNIVATPLYWNQKIPVGGNTEFGVQLQFLGFLPEPHFFLQQFVCK
jgi:cellulase/cellobiase CelA1